MYDKMMCFCWWVYFLLFGGDVDLGQQHHTHHMHLDLH